MAPDVMDGEQPEPVAYSANQLSANAQDVNDALHVLFGGQSKIDAALWFVDHSFEPGHLRRIARETHWETNSATFKALTRMANAGLLARGPNKGPGYDKVDYSPTNSPFWSVVEAIASVKAKSIGFSEPKSSFDTPKSPEEYVNYTNASIKLLFCYPTRFYVGIWLLQHSDQEPPYYGRRLADEAGLAISDVHRALNLFCDLKMLSRYVDQGAGKRVIRYELCSSPYWSIFAAGANALASIDPLSPFIIHSRIARED